MQKVNYNDTFVKDIQIGDKTIRIEVGRFSEQASAAVLATCGGTVVHSTIALGKEVNLGYFPLSVEFNEKLYAGGIIKGSRWVKREGRPTDEAILKARVIDRSVRPLFADGIRNEVQIINTVFSFDGENDPDVIGLLASSIGLSISAIPFAGPLAGLRVAYSKTSKEFVFNPSYAEREELDLDMIVSGSGESVVMVEASAKEVDEDVIVEALEKSQETFATVCADIQEIVKAVGEEKLELVEPPATEEVEFLEKLKKDISKKYADDIRTIVEKRARLEKSNFIDLLDKIVEESNEGKDGLEEMVLTVDEKQVESILYELMKKQARAMILEEGVRPDGRKPEEIRQIWTEVDLFERTHGSAMFKRGATQAVTVTTLGSPSLGQHTEDMMGEAVRHYMHFYNMPPYASGEAGRVGWPKRREIGHGALAERALVPVIPSQEEFPYTIHVVSEILSSNGSTSQASVCGSTLSLMAAGVPIKRPISGIAMGLMSDGEKHVVLSDIQGLEDHVGDMDFKVAGSSEGITAIQMDIKLTGLPREILVKALAQAKVGRAHILEEMLKVLPEPRTELSSHAPKIQHLSVPHEKIGELIGPGGKMIKEIIAKSGAQVDVESNDEEKTGTVYISAVDQEAIDMAAQMVSDITRVLVEGDEFDGAITRVEGYGVFVEFLPGREGLVHVSEMSTGYIENPADEYRLGQLVHVRVNEIKEDGKIGLSMLSQEESAEARENARSRGAKPRPQFRGGRQRGGRDNDRGNSRGSGRNYNRRNNRDNSRSSRGKDSGFKSQLT